MHLPPRRATLLILCALSAARIQPAIAADPPANEGPTAAELLYYWGATFGDQLKSASVLGRKDVESVVRGLRDSAAGKSPEFGEEYRSLLNNHLIARRREAAQVEAAEARRFVALAAERRGAVTTAGGGVYEERTSGSGAQPTGESRVRVHYVGTLRDGKEFDSSRRRGAPLETRLSAVIPCWREAIPLMKVGGEARITCPPEAAYGEQGNARIPGGAALIFDVELLGVLE
jgi:FKBP-type peptidyl-prolyl cis-trans isomerase FkpA